MNKLILFLVSVVLLTSVVSCSKKLELIKEQEATISPQAAAFIKHSKNFKLPSFVPLSAAQVVKGRGQFNASEIKVEEEIIKKYDLKIEKTSIAGVPVLIISPKQIKSGLEDAIALNIHGGGFIMGTARDRTALLMAGEIGIRVYSVEYTLAPEAQYPVAINQCLDVYKNLVNNNNPKRMIGISSSSGGELMLETLLRAQRQGLPMIKSQVLFTPGADISGNGDSGYSNGDRDVTTTTLSLRLVKDFYLGGANPTDPLVSPLYAQFTTNFPSSVITTGTRDFLESNGVRLFWKLKEAKVTTQLLIGEGMWHGYNWEIDLPEAVEVRRAVIEFLNAQLTI